MRILIGVDGSSQALAGARWVAGLPLTASDEVLVAAIAQPPVLLGTWWYARTGEPGDAITAAWGAEQAAAQAIADAGAAAMGDPASQVRGTVRVGHPVEALVRLVGEVDADLVVVGPHGHGRLESLLMGSVTQGLLHRMPAPVLVAREPVTRPVRVLLATDGSTHSLAAAACLARFPLPVDARIEVVAVCGAPIGLQASEELAWGSDAVEATMAALSADGRDAEPHIRHGDPKAEILAAIRDREIDLLVTGSRGLGGFAGLVLGSVSRALAMVAPCAVLVVPGRPAGGT
jgi:nucleotide-binding universal stress UspA family protein